MIKTAITAINQVQSLNLYKIKENRIKIWEMDYEQNTETKKLTDVYV